VLRALQRSETTHRPLLPACASALRMKGTQQRCHDACSHLFQAGSVIGKRPPRTPGMAGLRIAILVDDEVDIGRVRDEVAQ
jgi:hypothetical protein